jgi:hypothetical protein
MGLTTHFFSLAPKLTRYTNTKNGYGYRFRYCHEDTKDSIMGVFMLIDD